MGAQFVHFSTDYVFDGTKAPYKPGDATNPLQGYGVSKRDAELAVLAAAPKTGLVVRIPVLYADDCEALDESATLVVAKDVLSGKEKKIDNWGARFPTHVADVAALVKRILEKEAPFGGIIHFSGDTSILNTKYTIAQMMGDILGMCNSLFFILIVDVNLI